MRNIKMIRWLMIVGLLVGHLLWAAGTSAVSTNAAAYPDLTGYNASDSKDNFPIMTSSNAVSMNLVSKYDTIGGAIDSGTNVIGIISPAGSSEYSYMRMISLGSAFSGGSATDDFNRLQKGPADSSQGTMAAGYPAFLGIGDQKTGSTGASDLRPLIFDVYPGTSNIVSSGSAFVAFKYDTTLMRTITVNIYVGGTGSPKTFVVPAGNGLINSVPGFTPTKIDMGSGIYAVLIQGGTAAPGTSFQVSIFGDRLYGGQEVITFNYLVAGVPFLGTSVLNNVAPTGIDSSSLTLTSQLYGWSAAGNADINGDGIPDVVVSDPYYKYSGSNVDANRSGIVYVYFGRADKINTQTKKMAPDLIIENKTDYTLYDDKGVVLTSPTVIPSREFGYLVKLGDINNDGYADIIIGQPAYNNNKGRIVIYYGGPQFNDGTCAVDASKPSVVIQNSGALAVGDKDNIETSDLLGSMFDVGEVNGDGYADIIARCGDSILYYSGAMIRNTVFDQRIQLYPVALDARQLTFVKNIVVAGAENLANRNSAICIIGNFHGQTDGTGDFAISVPIPNNTETFSSVYVYYGSDISRNVVSIKHTLQDSTFSNCWFGWSLAAGHINKDPYADLIVGKRTEPVVTTAKPDTGKVALFMGGTDLPNRLYLNDEPRSGAGSSSQGVYAIKEPLASLYASSTSVTANRANQFGFAVACAGDLDGDGVEDIVVGAPYHGETDTGAVYVFLGSALGSGQYLTNYNDIKKFVMTGSEPYGHFGMCLSSVGSFDTSGYNGVLVAAPGFMSNDAGFSGWRSALGSASLGIGYVATHSIDIYTNVFGIDNALPVLVNSSIKNGAVGINPAAKTTLLFADQGSAGLDINSLVVQLYKLGGSGSALRTIWPSSGATGGNGVSVFNQNKQNRDSQYHIRMYAKAYDSTTYEKMYDSDDDDNNVDTVSSEAKKFYTVAVSYADIYSIYKYVRPAQMLRVEFTPKAGNVQSIFGSTNEPLRPKQFFYKAIVGDKSNLTVPVAPFEDSLALSLNFTTQLEFDSSLTTTESYKLNTNSGLPAAYKLVSIGDFDGDKRNDFAYRSKVDGQDAVNIYFGRPDLDLSKNPDLVIKSNLSHDHNFGRVILGVHNNASGQTLVIGSEETLYFIPFIPRQMSRLVDTTITQVMTYDLSSGIERYETRQSMPPGYYAQKLARKDGNEFVAIASFSGGVVRVEVANNVGVIDSTKTSSFAQSNGYPETNATITAVATGYYTTGDYQQVAVGLAAGSTAPNGCVILMDPAQPLLPKIIKNTTMPGAQFGFALAAGNFRGTYVGDMNGVVTMSGTTDLAIGAPGAAGYGLDSGMVFVIKNPFTLTKDTVADILQATPEQVVRLTPENKGSRFGESLISAKFNATFAHYDFWNKPDNYAVPYFDDADDLIVAAPRFTDTLFLNNSDATVNAHSKIYIYNGATENAQLDSHPDSGWIFTQNGNALSLCLAGDIYDGKNDIFFACGDQAMSFVNSGIPNASPPSIKILPEDRAYEVSLNSNITMNFSSSCGILPTSIYVTRLINNVPVPIIAGGQLQTKFLSEFTTLNTRTVSSKTLELVLQRNPLNPWKESEVVQLTLAAGTNRIVKKYNMSSGLWEDSPASVTASYMTGFVTTFKSNSMSATVNFTGSKDSNTYFGKTVVNVGDINQDSYPEFAISEPGFSDGSGVNVGRVRLYSSDPQALKSPTAMKDINYGITGLGNGSAHFGWNVAPAGDMAGTGYKDIAILAKNTGSNGAEVFVLFGNPDPVSGNPGPDGAPNAYIWSPAYIHERALCIQAAQAGDGLGESMWNGDVNGDGYADLVLGAPNYTEDDKTYAGRVYVIFGTADMQIPGKYALSNSQAVAGAYNGPIRLSDPAICKDLLNLPAGSPLPLAGYISIPTDNANHQDYQFGASVLAGVNLTGDTVTVSRQLNGRAYTDTVGVSEIIIGAPGYKEGAGKVYLFTRNVEQPGKIQRLSFSGKTQEGNTLTLEGVKPGDHFGFSLASMEDISADGLNKIAVADDFAVGAPGYDVTFVSRPEIYQNAGAAYVYSASGLTSGTTLPLKEIMRAQGQNEGDNFGFSLAQVGNVNNNSFGVNNLAVGAPFFSSSTKSNLGRSYIFGTDYVQNAADGKYSLIMSPYPIFIATGEDANSLYGYSIASLGDTDDDYVPEYLVAAPGMAGTGSNITSNAAISTSIGNVGRVLLFSNPDTTAPFIYDTVGDVPVSLFPAPAEKAAELAKLSINNGVEQRTYDTLKFEIADDRSIKLDTVMLSLQEKNKKGHDVTRNFVFVGDSTGRAIPQMLTRKHYSFEVSLKDILRYRTTYNATIYAKDKTGNSLLYDYAGFAPFTTGHASPVHRDQLPGQPCFTYSFVTSGNPFAEPEFTDFGLEDTNALLAGKSYISNNAYLNLDVLSEVNPIVSMSVAINPANAAVISTDPINQLVAFGVTFDLQPPTYNFALEPKSVLVDFSAGPYANNDVAFTLRATAIDSKGHLVSWNETFFRDVQPPILTPVSPLAGATNVADNAPITVSIRDAGTGVNMDSLHVVINDNGHTIIVPTAQYTVTVNNPQGIMTDKIMPYCPELILTITGMKFNYLDPVTVSVHAEDNAGHIMDSAYAFTVSPDYRAPKVFADSMRILELFYTTGNLTVSTSAWDDTAVKAVVFTVVQDQSGAVGLVTRDAPTDTLGVKRLVINLDAGDITQNYSGLQKLKFWRTDLPYAASGDVFVGVSFLDIRDNESLMVTGAIRIAPQSIYGGPIMPMILVTDKNKAVPPDSIQTIQKSFNTPSLNLWVMASDEVVSPSRAYDPKVVGFVVSVKDSSGSYRKLYSRTGDLVDISVPRSDVLLPYNMNVGGTYLDAYKADGDMLYVPAIARMYRKLTVGLDPSIQEGVLTFYVNFVDNDSNVANHLTDAYDGSSLAEHIFGLGLDGQLSLPADAPESKPAHPINRLTLAPFSLAQSSHFCDLPAFAITVNYDTTAPTLEKLVAYGRTWLNGESSEKYMYTKDLSGLRILVEYKDVVKNTAVRYPVNDLYYQVICITDNAQLLVVDTDLNNRIIQSDGRTWERDARYTSYAKNYVTVNNMLYIATPSMSINATYNTLAIGDSLTISENQFVTDNLASTVFAQTNMTNWTHLNLRNPSSNYADSYDVSLGVDGSGKGIFLPVQLAAGNKGYYVRVCVRDAAGNYSAILTSNPVVVDTKIPNDTGTTIYMKEGLKLNRNVLNMSFIDDASGIASIEVRTPAMGETTPVYGREFLGQQVTINGRGGAVVFPVNYSKNLVLPTAFWKDLPEKENTLTFILRDAVGNERKTTDFNFSKATIPLALSVVPQGTHLQTMAGRWYTKDDQITLSVALADVHTLILSNAKFDDVFSVTRSTDLAVVKDFSGEDAGDAGNLSQVLLPLINTADALVTSQITFLEQKNVTDSISTKHYLGNYAQAVAFNVTQNNQGGSTYTWAGMATTVDITSLIQKGNRLFTFGLFLDASMLQQQESSSVPYPIGPASITSNVAAQQTRGCLVLTVKVSGNPVEFISTDKILKENGSLPSWKLLSVTMNIDPALLGSGPIVATVSVQHRQYLNIQQPFVFTSPTEQSFTGRLLVDGLMVIPGRVVTGAVNEQVPYIVSKAKQQAYTFSYAVTQGVNTFVYGAYDEVGNLSTGSMTVICDTEPPTFAPAAAMETVTRAITEVSRLALPFGTTAYYQRLADTLPSANGVDVKILSVDGTTYTNSYTKDTGTIGTLYLSSAFLAYDPATVPITKYTFQLFRLNSDGSSAFMDGATLNATDWGNGNSGMLINEKVAANYPLSNGYYFVGRAVNLLGYTSDPVTTDVIRIDVDVPTVSVTYTPSIVSTLSETVTIDSGWYTGPITVTVSAVDILWNSNVSYNVGGAGVSQIVVVTNNGTPTMFDVSAQPALTKVITFNLTEEGANSFTVYALDGLNQKSLVTSVTNNLNIDTVAPTVSIIPDDGIGYSSDVEDLKWTNNPSGIFFKVNYSDRLGVGSQRLYWWVDGVPQDSILLDDGAIGRNGLITYPSRSVPTSNPTVSHKNKEGIIGGKFAYTYIDGLAEETQDETALLSAGIIVDQGGMYYWNNDIKTNPPFVNESELMALLVSKNIALKDVSRVMSAWRLGSMYNDPSNQYNYGNTNYYPMANRLLQIDSLQMRFDKDGYHTVVVQLEDKFHNKSALVTYNYFAIDRRVPEVRFSLGGNFQSEWSLNPVPLRVHAYDVFRDPVLLIGENYSAAVSENIPDTLSGLNVIRPGSGVKEILVTINGVLNSYSIKQDDADQRFDVYLDWFNNHSELIIRKNGLNNIEYMSADWAGNTSAYSLAPSKNALWNSDFNTYAYDGDQGVIRGIKIDTECPTAGFIIVATKNFTDNLTSANPGYATYIAAHPTDNKAYYTNQRTVEFQFGALDSGIGVRYGLVTENNGFGLDTSRGDATTFLSVGTWNDIAGLTGAPMPVLTGPKLNLDPRAAGTIVVVGIQDYKDVTRSVYMTPDNGSRTLAMAFADDFGLNYFVTFASLENRSSTFNADPASLESQNNYMPEDVVSSGRFGARTIDGVSYYFWNGPFDVATANYDTNPLRPRTMTGDLLGQPHGYAIKPLVINNVTMDVYVWNQEMPATASHMTQPYLANRDIYLDDRIAMNTPNFAIDPRYMSVDVVSVLQDGSSVTDDIVSTSTIRVQFKADETGEVSGITYVMFGGEIVNAAGCISPNVWVPYPYKSTVTVSYDLRLAIPTDDRVVTVSIVGIKDRAGNEIGTISRKILNGFTSTAIAQVFFSNLFVNPFDDSLVLKKDIDVASIVNSYAGFTAAEKVSINAYILEYGKRNLVSRDFFFDRPMLRDNLSQRLQIRDAKNNIVYRYGTGVDAAGYYVSAATFNIYVNVPYFNSFTVYEGNYPSQSLVTKSISSGLRFEDPKIYQDGSYYVIPCAFDGDFAGEGKRMIGITLRDMGTAPTSIISANYEFIMDSTAPVASINGIVTTNFYAPSVTFSITVADLDKLGLPNAFVSGLKKVEMKINSHSYVWTAAEYAKKYPNWNKLDVQLQYFEDFDGQSIQAGKHTPLAVMETGVMNRIEVTTYDRLDNHSTYVLGDIQVNATPPLIDATTLSLSNSGNVEIVSGKPIVYVNTATPKVLFNGRGSFMDISGDKLSAWDGHINVSNWSTYQELQLSDEQDGTKNLTVVVKDGLSDPMNGRMAGPSAMINYLVYLDRGLPQGTMDASPLVGTAEALTLIPDTAMLQGTVLDLPRDGVLGYASGAQMHIVGATDVVVTPSGTVWSKSVLELLRADGKIAGVHTYKVFARDRATNTTMIKNVTIAVTDNYFIAHGETNVSRVVVQQLSKDASLFAQANQALVGIKPVASLDATLHDFQAYDSGNNSIHMISGTGNVELVMAYPLEAAKDSDPANFRVYYFNGTVWELATEQQVVDKEARTITLPLTHFSIYRVFATVGFAQDLKAVHMYPNPYMGSDDDKLNGDDSDSNYNKVIFENITKTAKIRIYTISGELVRTIEEGKSQIPWDLNNDQGQKVASGVYLVLITDDDGGRHMGRLTVVR